VRRQDRAGSAAVELAIVLPLALVVGLGLLQVGLVAKEALVVAGAAREGVREAAVTMDQARIREAVLRGGGGLASDRTDVSVERTGGVGDPVTVRVRFRSALIVPFVEWLFPEEVVVSAEATMRQETDGAPP
jgi:hypothetical protein